jgi:hypothetical protein
LRINLSFSFTGKKIVIVELNTMGSPFVESKSSEHDQKIKEWKKICYLPQVRRALDLFQKPCPQSRDGKISV